MSLPVLLRLHHWLTKRRALALGLCGLCWLCAALAASSVRFDTGLAAFFPDNDPLVSALTIESKRVFLDLAAQSPEDLPDLALAADHIKDAMPLKLAQEDRPRLPSPRELLPLIPYFFDEAACARLTRLATDPAAQAEHVRTLAARLGTSLGGTLTTWVLEDPFSLHTLITDHVPQSNFLPLPDPILGYSVSQDKRHLLLVLRTSFSLHDADAASRFRTLLAEAIPPAYVVTATGGPLYSARNRDVINRDVERIVFFSLLGFSAVYLVLVRSLAALWLLCVPWYAASVAIGVMAALTPVLSGLALGFGASLLGVAEDYAVHVHFAEDYTSLGRPLAQGFCVNAAGFVVLLFSAIPAIRQLALFSLVTLAVGFVLAVTIFPLLPNYPNYPPKKRTSATAPAVPPMSPHVGRIAVCVTLLLLLACVLFIKTKVDVSPKALGVAADELAAKAHELRTRWGIGELAHILVSGATEEEALAKAREIVTTIRAYNPDLKLLTPTDLWPAPDIRARNCARWQEFLEKNGERLTALGNTLLRNLGLAETSTIHLPGPADPTHLKEALTRAGFGPFLEHTLEYGRGQAGDMGWQCRILTPNPPDIPGTVVLTPAHVHERLTATFVAESHLLPLAGLVCCVLLIVIFRRFSLAALCTIPPLCSLVTVLAWMVVREHTVTLASLAAMPLVLGLACDHGILVAHDLTHGVRSGGERAVLVSTLTSLTGMGLLAFAEHPALRSMGDVIFFGLIVEIPCALFLLPRCCRPAQH